MHTPIRDELVQSSLRQRLLYLTMKDISSGLPTTRRNMSRTRHNRKSNSVAVLLLASLPGLLSWTTDALAPSSSSSSRKQPLSNVRQATASPEKETETYPSNRNTQRHSKLSPSSSMDKLSSTVSVERLIVTAGRKGRTDEALRMYRQLDRPTIREVNAAIDACARARPVRLDEAFAILSESPLPPNVYSFGSLMNACARTGNVERAQRLLREMPAKYNVEPNAVVYHAAVSACDKAQPPRPDIAWQLLDQARNDGLALSVVGYNAALSAAARAGDVDKAVKLLELMEEQQQQQNASNEENRVALVPRPDAVTYGTLLAAFERVEDWNSLMTYAARMQKAGHALDGLAITNILHACQQLGLVREALQYFHRMKEVGPYRRQTAGYEVVGHKAPIEGPDAVAFMLAIGACARGGAWREGLKLLDEYTVKGHMEDVAVFTTAIRGCELAGEYQTAFQLVDRMLHLKVQPNEMTFTSVIGACAMACAKMSDDDENSRQLPLRKALRLLRVLHKDPSTVSPNIQIYNAAIRVCAEAHQIEEAFGLVDDLANYDHLEPNVVTYGTLMSACERVGSIEDVNKVFQRMRQDGVKANEVVYGAAISCCRKAGDPERAVLLLRKMIRDEIQPNVATFNTVLTAQVEAKGRGPKQLERAMIVFQLLCSKKYSAASPNRQTFNLMIRFLAECQRPREAEILLRTMRQEHSFIPDVHLYTVVVTAYERLGQPLKALRLMESMNVDGYDFYEAKVLNAAFKRALKVANVMGRGFSGVHDDDKDFAQDGSTFKTNFATSLQSQVATERFVHGNQLSDEEEGDSGLLGP